MKTSVMILGAFLVAALPPQIFAAPAATSDEKADLTVIYTVPSVLSLNVSNPAINLKIGGGDYTPFGVMTLEIENTETDAVIYVSDSNDGHVVNGVNKIKYYLSCDGGERSVQPLNECKLLLKDVRKGKTEHKVIVFLNEEDARAAAAGEYKGHVTFQIVGS